MTMMQQPKMSRLGSFKETVDRRPGECLPLPPLEVRRVGLDGRKY